MSIQSYFRTSSFFGPFEFSSNLDSLRLSATTRNVFAQLDLSGTMIAPGWEKFNLMVGARLNHHSAFGTDASVEFNPAYRIDHGGILYASFSTGLNAPSLYQLYTPERDYSSGITRGNPGLQPERSRSLEFGWKYSSSGGLFCSLALFGTIVENSIEYVYLWEKSVSIDQLGKDFSRNDFRGDTYLNLSRQTTRGFEGTFGTRLGDRWSITANLSVVGGTLEYHPSDINQLQTQGHWVQLYGNGAFLTQDLQSTDLVRRPNTANVSLEYRAMEAWTLRFDVRHAGQRSDVYYDSQRGPYGALGSQPVEAYTIVDLLQHFQFGKDWSANFRVENVMNKKYLEINGFTTRGRGVYLNIRSQWDRLW
jgi:vitamin B12 transporter